ncbi:MAG: GWxTD domain-containing protein [Bacteroidia bacterium]|nr:GWxTD domain-containing protein [Bacteroidia bacterium]
MPVRLNFTNRTFCIAVVFAVAVLPATLLSQQDQKLRMDVDLASFRFGADTSFVELYYAFPRSALTFSYEEGVYRGAALMHAILRSQDRDEDPVLKAWRVPVQLQDTANLEQRSLIGRVNFLLKPGRYNITVIGRDEHQAALSDSVAMLYEVRGFGPKNPLFSDIELASSIERAEEDAANIFYKNTLEVIPNPALLYGKQLPNVLYYAELYNGDLEHFMVKSEIVSSYGKTMISTAKKRSGKHPSRVEVGSLNTSTLPSGVYTLILSLGDTTGQMKLSQSKMFYVFNPDIPLDTAAAVAVADLIAAEFTAMSESELDDQFAMATYICSKDERNIWKSLSGAEPKKKFLTKFWRDRDPDYSTPSNEAYDVYKQLIAAANEQFRTAYRKGWKSDRGRVFILYGPPDYVERRSNESDMKPHEIWRYDNIEGGVEFVFVDRGGFNDYELVHSTKRNEISNEDWQRNASTR